MITITELLDEQEISYKTTEQHKNIRDGWIGVDCPYCGDRDTYHLGITLEGNRTSCWKCGWHPLTNVLMILTHKPYATCKAWAENLSPDQVEDRREKQARGTLKIPKGVGSLLNCHKKYLKGRGLNPNELEEKWGIGGIGIASQYAWRIFIPIQYWGKTVSWTTRSLCDKGLRYITAKPEQEAISPKQFLFGEQHCLHTIIVVEGVFDVFKIGYGAVATLGVGYSQEQFECMTKYPRRIICFDNEPLVQNRAAILCENLSAYPGETINLRLEAKDPGSTPQYKIDNIRKQFLE
jgi:hypothetical protein